MAVKFFVLFLPDFCLENPDFLVELSDTIDFLDLDLEYDLDSDFFADWAWYFLTIYLSDSFYIVAEPV